MRKQKTIAQERRAARSLQGWLWGWMALSAAGLLVAGYLSFERLTGGNLVCSRWAQCDTVNSSPYARFFGVPVAFIGFAGYLLLLGLALAALAADGGRPRRLLLLGFLLSLGGVGFSAYLTYLEIYVIKAVCSWCVASATIITLLAVLGALALWRTATPSPRASANSRPHRR